VTKVGRDAVLYVESLIESIMGGLEGLINILDSEGGFGSLEMQLLPEQAAAYLNSSSKHSIPGTKSPRGLSGIPGHESFPENNNSIKMLEAAMQRLTNLCSVLNDMEPICVLNHVFVLREYMRECILGNFRRRLLSVLKTTDNDLQRPSVLESVVRRQMSIIHLAEQHVSMDLTQGIREVLLAEAFTGPISSLHLFDKPTNLHTGLATETMCNWYDENIVKDVSGAGVLFVPAHKCFRSTRPIGGYFAESVSDANELQAFIHLFGGYGVDRLKRMMKEHTAALINCIGTSLRSNRDILEAIAGSLHAGDRMESDANTKQIVDLDTVVEFCIQAGQALAFDQLISEASGDVLKEDAPLIYSLLEGIVPHLPKEVPEKKDISRTKEVANSIGVLNDHDTEFVRSIMEDTGVGNDSSWNLLPYLFSAFMSSNIWNTTRFNVETGGFNNNIHCLARCINAVIAGNEYVRMEKENQLANGHTDENLQNQMQSSLTAEASAKSTLLLYVKMSTGIILDCWNEANRSDLAPKLVFLDQMCEISPHLPRSSLEACIPYTIIRSLYNQYYGNSASLPLTSRSLSSPQNSPGVSLMHNSPAFRHHRSDSTQPHSDQSAYFKQSSSQSYDADSGSIQSNDRRHRNIRGSGPLEYTSSRKVKFNEGSTSGSTGPSPLPRFAVSRSGPILYK
ncbi:Protein NAP1, partial [Bienertia sinuspersici]